MNSIKMWLIAWVDLSVALVIIMTGAHVRLNWHWRVREYLCIEDKPIQQQDEEIIGI
jgi:hypothetical protein